jgi:hypothetical protein
MTQDTVSHARSVEAVIGDPARAVFPGQGRMFAGEGGRIVGFDENEFAGRGASETARESQWLKEITGHWTVFHAKGRGRRRGAILQIVGAVHRWKRLQFACI